MAAGKSPPPHGLLAKVSRLGAGPGEGGHASRLGHAPPRPAGDPGLQTPWDLAPARDACTAACSPPSSLPRRGAAVRVSWAPVSTLRPGARKGTGAARLPLPLPYGGNPGKLPRPGGREGSGLGPPPPAGTPRGRRGRGRLAPPVTCADTCPCAHSETSPQARGQLPSPRTGSLRSTRVRPQGPQHQD